MGYTPLDRQIAAYGFADRLLAEVADGTLTIAGARAVLASREAMAVAEQVQLSDDLMMVPAGGRRP